MYEFMLFFHQPSDIHRKYIKELYLVGKVTEKFSSSKMWCSWCMVIGATSIGGLCRLYRVTVKGCD